LTNLERPLQILRTIHSFDPCMACAIHMIDAAGNDPGEAATGLSVCVT
jgi:Ni,Fe-hydrogenase I large subunit